MPLPVRSQPNLQQSRIPTSTLAPPISELPSTTYGSPPTSPAVSANLRQRKPAIISAIAATTGPGPRSTLATSKRLPITGGLRSADR